MALINPGQLLEEAQLLLLLPVLCRHLWWMLAPDLAIDGPARLLLADADAVLIPLSPLLEEEGDAEEEALVTEVPEPVRVGGSGVLPGLSTGDDPL